MHTGLHVNIRYYCQIPIELEFSKQIFFKRILNLRFHENRPTDSRDVACGQRDKHDEATGVLISP